MSFIISLKRAILNGPLLKLLNKIGEKFAPKIWMNINLDLCNPVQKRVLLCYLWLGKTDIINVSHANVLHANQMIHWLISEGFCIDVCDVKDEDIHPLLKSHQYDFVIGFGPIYKKILLQNPRPICIHFVTENNPDVVVNKYRERVEYFKKRHSDIILRDSVCRDQYYDHFQLTSSDYCILMSSQYNENSFLPFFKKVYRVNSNAIINSNYTFYEHEVRQWINKSKRRFLWFGSVGLIHKGVDLLCDAFRRMPDISLDLYGVNPAEKKLLCQLMPDNVHDCGRISVQSEEFVHEIIAQYNFVIFPSCSEGMSTALTTCMCHGIIPVVTKESGLDFNKHIIQLDGWKVNDICRTVRRLLNFSEEEILLMRKNVYEYARNAFSLETFTTQFGNAMSSIIADCKRSDTDKKVTIPK